MKRLAWLLLAAFGTTFVPVQPVCGPAPTAQTSCGLARTCADHAPAPGTDQPAGERPECLLCSASCCFAVLPATDMPGAALSPVARLDHRVEKGLQRTDPPLLTPPRRLG